jgi:hypothetical protein
LISCNWLIDKIIFVSCTSIKSVSIWEVHLLWNVLCVGVGSFRNEVILVSCCSIEWSITGVILFVLYSSYIFSYTLRCISWLIPWSSFKWNVFILIFNPWNYFLSQLWFMAWIVFSIGWIQITIWFIIILCLYLFSDKI